jgi:hypothetical protein
MENQQERPDRSSTAAAAAAIYAGIPLLAAAPFLTTYLITGNIQKAVVYPLLAAMVGIPALATLAVVLFAVIYLIRLSWTAITMPTARRLQNVKDRITGKARAQSLE